MSLAYARCADSRDDAIDEAIKRLTAAEKFDYVLQWFSETPIMEGHIRRTYATRMPLGGAEIGVNLADEFNDWLRKNVAEDQNL